MAEKFDLHTHTQFSDGKAPLELNVRSAEAAGLVAFAVTDHLFSPGQISGGAPIAEYLDAIAAAQEKTAVRLLRGVEAQALDASGRTAVDGPTRAALEIVLCDLGGQTRGIFRDAPDSSAEFYENVRRCYIGLAENPSIDVIAHPFNLGRLGRGITPGNLPRSLVAEVVEAMALSGTAFEVMNDNHYWFPEILGRSDRRGVRRDRGDGRRDRLPAERRLRRALPPGSRPSDLGLGDTAAGGSRRVQAGRLAPIRELADHAEHELESGAGERASCAVARQSIAAHEWINSHLHLGYDERRTARFPVAPFATERLPVIATYS